MIEMAGDAGRIKQSGVKTRGWMKDKVNAPEPGERRTNYRAYLGKRANYLTEVEQFSAAKEIYDDDSVLVRPKETRPLEILSSSRCTEALGEVDKKGPCNSSVHVAKRALPFVVPT